MAKRFPRQRLTQVHFDKRQPHCQQGITQGDAGVRERSRIEHDAADVLIAALLNALDQLMFGVVLMLFNGKAAGGSEALARGHDVGQAGIAINRLLAVAKQIQIWTIEQQNAGHCLDFPVVYLFVCNCEVCNMQLDKSSHFHEFVYQLLHFPGISMTINGLMAVSCRLETGIDR